MEGSPEVRRADRGAVVSCPVPPAARDLVGDDAFEYSDAFVLALPAGDRHSAEEWARAMLTPSGPVLNAFAAAWAATTGVQPPRQGRRLGPFRVLTPDRAAAVHTADGPRYRIHLVILVGEGRMTFATFVKAHSALWRHPLTWIMVAHRRVAPLMMERAVDVMSRS